MQLSPQEHHKAYSA